MVVRGLIVGDYREKDDAFGLWGDEGREVSYTLSGLLKKYYESNPIAFSSRYMKNARVVVPGELL